jgi:beta-lactamase regulating signal transducer with metallopeptidase domain
MATFLEIALWNAAAAAVLALAAAAASRLFRRPALTHTLWVLVLLKLVTPPLVPFPLALPVAEDRPAPPTEAMAAAAPADDADLPAADPAPEGEEVLPATLPEPDPLPAVAPAVDWGRWASLTWLLGSGLWGTWVAWHVVRFRRVLRRARRAPGRLREEAEALARRLGLRRCPEVWLVPGAVSPMVWGLGGRPCLLFPAGLLDRLDAGGRAALLAHELAHVRRRDHWVRLLELAATGLYWWHPALWWARRELHEAEEQCCDAWAVWALGGDARPYALALLQAVAFVSQARLPLPLGASGVGQVSHLKRRLTMVMQGKTSRSLSWAGLAVVGGLGLLLLPLFPALGQQPPTPAPGARADPAPGADRNQQIEELKRLLRKLEAERAHEAGALAERDVRAAQADVLQAQLKELERAMAAKKKELEELQAKASALRAKLKEMEAGGARRDDYNRSQPPGAVRPPAADRVNDVERKLDQLQKELEELRRELRRDRTAPRGGTGFPGQPKPPEPPPVRRPADEAPAAPVLPPAPAGADRAPAAPAPPGALPPAPTTPPPPPGAAPSGTPPATPLPPSRALPPTTDPPPPTGTTPRS